MIHDFSIKIPGDNINFSIEFGGVKHNFSIIIILPGQNFGFHGKCRHGSDYERHCLAAGFIQNRIRSYSRKNNIYTAEIQVKRGLSSDCYSKMNNNRFAYNIRKYCFRDISVCFKESTLNALQRGCSMCAKESRIPSCTFFLEKGTCIG